MNENDDETSVGDISIFRSVGEACRYLEHWWVEESLGFALTAAGERLTFGVKDGAVIVLQRKAIPDGKMKVQKWLRESAKAVLEARRYKAKRRKVILGKIEEQGALPESVEGLIAYVGFHS